MTAVDTTFEAQFADGYRTMVLFDWNGTIVLDHDRARNALNEALAHNKIAAVNMAEFTKVFRLPMSDMFTDLGVPPVELLNAEALWNSHMASHRSVLRAGAISALEALSIAGVRLGIVSAAASRAVDFDRASLSVPEVWVSVDSAVSDKVAVLQSHRSNREVALYVGDTAYDMTSASAAGYVPIGVSGGYATADVLERAGAAHIVENLDCLIEIAAGYSAVN